MENAKVIIIEDDPMTREDCRLNLEVRNHVIVGEAGTVGQAEQLIDSLQSAEVDLAVVDGNLSRGAVDGAEGEHIAGLIHVKLPGVVVVGCSLDGQVRGADINVRKGDSWALDALVTKLERP